MEEYKHKIVELVGKITPTTPPEVRYPKERRNPLNKQLIFHWKLRK
jgi:hypothetical protein